MEINNTIRVLKGAQSLLLILPQEVASKLNLANQEWMKFEVKERDLVIKKMEQKERDGIK